MSVFAPQIQPEIHLCVTVFHPQAKAYIHWHSLSLSSLIWMSRFAECFQFKTIK